MKKITLKEMFETEIQDILNHYEAGYHKYFWKNGEGQYKEIIRIELLRGVFITEDGVCIKFEQGMKESQIYMDEKLYP